MTGSGSTAPNSRAKRFSRANWLDLGLRELVSHGGGALTVERLCDAAGRTRGSFYHHFADQSAFVSALAEEWRERQTVAVIRAIEADTGSAEAAGRLDALQRLASGLDHHLDLAMRRWGFADATVGAAVAAVDAERLQYLADLHRSLDTGEDAARLAEAEYALFVGAQLLWPDRSADELVALKTTARR